MSVCPCVCSNKTNDKAYVCARSPTQIHDLLSVTGFDKIGQKCRKHSQQKNMTKKHPKSNLRNLKLRSFIWFFCGVEKRTEKSGLQ